MSEEKYTLNEYAEMMKKNKWHLIEIEEMIKQTDYGTVEIRLEVRAGAVEKIAFFNSKTYLRPKEGHGQNADLKEKLKTGIFEI